MIKEDYVSDETHADRRVRLVRYGINEDYVSWETAKLLKENGFDEMTLAWYTGKGKFCVSKNTYNDYHMNEFSDTTLKHKNTCSAPTLQMAMKWIREKYQLSIEPYFTHNNSFSFKIQEIPTGVCQFIKDGNKKEFQTYEESCEAAIRYCLENLI